MGKNQSYFGFKSLVVGVKGPCPFQLSVRLVQGGPLPVINGVITPYKWPYKWVTGVVITPFITGKGPPCKSYLYYFEFGSQKPE